MFIVTTEDKWKEVQQNLTKARMDLAEVQDILDEIEGTIYLDQKSSTFHYSCNKLLIH
jgi:hypothetical protein